MSSKKLKVAVVGATGAVGETMLSILAERRFPASDIIALASERSAGTEVMVGDEEIEVQDLATDLAFVEAHGACSRRVRDHPGVAGKMPRHCFGCVPPRHGRPQQERGPEGPLADA